MDLGPDGPVFFAMSRISQASFLRFVLVGGSATLLHYAIMGTLIYLASITAGIASAIGYTLSTFYNYWANSYFTFGGGHSHARSLPRFLVTALAGLGINQIVLLAGIYVSLSLAIAQFTATAAVLLWNYRVNATWTFARKERQS
jgi:putative flippase GtrA